MKATLEHIIGKRIREAKQGWYVEVTVEIKGERDMIKFGPFKDKEESNEFYNKLIN